MKKDRVIRSSLRFGAVVCFVISALLLAWALISEIAFFEEKYMEYLTWLDTVEHNVASIGNKWLIFIVILLLYFIHSAIPVYPVSILCVATALVFNIPSALVINLAGETVLFTVRYFMGKHQGGGGLQKLIRKSSVAKKIVESNGQGNPWLLAVCRILPGISNNVVSQLFGAMAFPYGKYIFISLAAYLPKTMSYIIIGRNAYNPFSLKLSIPLVILSVASGFTMLSLSKVWDAAKKHYQEDN